jgi:hypothetical protein
MALIQMILSFNENNDVGAIAQRRRQAKAVFGKMGRENCDPHSAMMQGIGASGHPRFVLQLRGSNVNSVGRISTLLRRLPACSPSDSRWCGMLIAKP